MPRPRPPRRSARAAVPAVLLALGLAVTGCAQPEEANNNGPQPQPEQPGDVVSEPTPVESAPAVVPEVPADTEVSPVAE